MGSFDYTCAVSNLPIHAGDKVRYLLLTENPYEENKGCRACSMHDWWFPRTFPLRAEYNDYGSVENVEEGPARDIWTEALNIDLVACGWGDNSAHDVPTSKDMSFDELLTAVQEGRVKVRQDVGESAPESLGVRTVPEGVPTLERVIAGLQKAGLPLFGGWGKGGFLVDNREGTVRVRWHGEGSNWDAEALQKAQKVLEDYATVIRAGTGSYSADLFVYAKPGTEGFNAFNASLKEKNQDLYVSQVLVREDVWQALLTLSVQDQWASKKAPTLDDFRIAAYKLYGKSLGLIEAYRATTEEKRVGDSPAGVDAILFELLGGNHDDPVSWIITRDLIPFTVGLATHWRLFVQQNLPVEQVETFLDSVAEMAYVHKVLMQVRYIWVPSSSRGAQVGEFDKHADFLKALVKVAKDRGKEDESRYRGDKEDDD